MMDSFGVHKLESQGWARQLYCAFQGPVPATRVRASWKLAVLRFVDAAKAWQHHQDMPSIQLGWEHAEDGGI